MQKTKKDSVKKREFTSEEKKFLGNTEFRWIRMDAVSYKDQDLTPKLKAELEKIGFVVSRKGASTTEFCMLKN